MNDRRTCENCVHFSFCSTMLKQHNNEVCEEHRKICPLPRIGSKEWGWGVKYKPPFNEPVWRSPFTRIVVERYEEREGVSEFNHRGCYIVIRPGCFGFNSVIYGFKNALRFAELLARRDWRRKNRGKK